MSAVFRRRGCAGLDIERDQRRRRKTKPRPREKAKSIASAVGSEEREPGVVQEQPLRSDEQTVATGGLPSQLVSTVPQPSSTPGLMAVLESSQSSAEQAGPTPKPSPSWSVHSTQPSSGTPLPF